MNAKQALRSVTKQLENQTFYNALASADIRDYNAVIDHMIGGGSPCDWCQDKEECQLQAKADGKGCDMWMLREQPKEVLENARQCK